MSRSYRNIVAEHRRQYPHQDRLSKTGDWRYDYCSRAHYQATRGVLVWWHEDGQSVFGFKDFDQAAMFQRWADTCGIDWSVEPRAQPLPHPEKPPERPHVVEGYYGHGGQYAGLAFERIEQCCTQRRQQSARGWACTRTTAPKLGTGERTKHRAASGGSP